MKHQASYDTQLTNHLILILIAGKLRNSLPNLVVLHIALYHSSPSQNCKTMSFRDQLKHQSKTNAELSWGNFLIMSQANWKLHLKEIQKNHWARKTRSCPKRTTLFSIVCLATQKLWGSVAIHYHLILLGESYST